MTKKGSLYEEEPLVKKVDRYDAPLTKKGSYFDDQPLTKKGSNFVDEEVVEEDQGLPEDYEIMGYSEPLER